jgi:hypothetical protein
MLETRHENARCLGTIKISDEGAYGQDLEGDS